MATEKGIPSKRTALPEEEASHQEDHIPSARKWLFRNVPQDKRNRFFVNSYMTTPAETQDTTASQAVHTLSEKQSTEPGKYTKVYTSISETDWQALLRTTYPPFSRNFTEAHDAPQAKFSPPTRTREATYVRDLPQDTATHKNNPLPASRPERRWFKALLQPRKPRITLIKENLSFDQKETAPTLIEQPRLTKALLYAVSQHLTDLDVLSRFFPSRASESASRNLYLTTEERKRAYFRQVPYYTQVRVDKRKVQHDTDYTFSTVVQRQAYLLEGETWQESYANFQKRLTDTMAPGDAPWKFSVQYPDTIRHTMPIAMTAEKPFSISDFSQRSSKDPIDRSRFLTDFAMGISSQVNHVLNSQTLSDELKDKFARLRRFAKDLS